MKKIITAFVFYFLCGECFSQAGEWVWIKGDSTTGSLGNFGVQGVPSPLNNPPGLYEPCEWTDLNGNFWLFGGLSTSGWYGDLWKYDPLTNEWTWMKGMGTINNMGSYGIQGIRSPSNLPPSRAYGISTWLDSVGNLWMFGGAGNGSFCDLWKYEILTNEWTWMKGSNTVNDMGVCGIQGVANPANYPGGRSETSCAWTDNYNNLWFFGGWQTPSFRLNDLWKYNIVSNQWTWMKGSQLPNQQGIYGITGIEDSLNTPGGREIYSHWKDIYGRLWFFGGGFLTNGSFSCFNDLWKYNIVTNNWTWISGDSSINVNGTYGIKCLSSPGNIPGARFESRSVWNDQFNNFWFFGGYSPSLALFNDLWKYCPVLNEWIWISGDSISSPVGHWGILGVSNPLNKPSGRAGSISWKNDNSHLYLFGGGSGRYNDLWKYTIDTTCGVCPAPNSIQENNFTNELLVFPNPTNSSLTISFPSSEKQTVELRIYNTLGEVQLFQSFKTLEKVFSTEINVERWSDGIYFLQLKTKEGNLNRKVVVQH